MSGESSDLTAKEKLLIWSQQATEGYPCLRCTNFTSCWSDGRMFNALLHRYRSVSSHSYNGSTVGSTFINLYGLMNVSHNSMHEI